MVTLIAEWQQGQQMLLECTEKKQKNRYLIYKSQIVGITLLQRETIPSNFYHQNRKYKCSPTHYPETQKDINCPVPFCSCSELLGHKVQVFGNTLCFLVRRRIQQSPLIWGDTFQSPQWMPETLDSTEPYTYYVFSYTHIPILKFNL